MSGYIKDAHSLSASCISKEKTQTASGANCSTQRSHCYAQPKNIFKLGLADLERFWFVLEKLGGRKRGLKFGKK